MHELITVALVLTCLCALVILVACCWAIVEVELKISIRVMDESIPGELPATWYTGLVRDGTDSDQLEQLINELDQVRAIALDDLARLEWREPYYDTSAGAWRDPIIGLFDENGPIE